MDTISRENTSMLPVAGIVVGVLSLLVGGYAAIKASSLQKTVATHEEKVAKIDNLEAQVNSVSAASEKSAKDINTLSRTTQDAFTTVSQMLGDANGKIKALEDAQKKPAAVAKGHASGEPVVAGPGEYVVKSGETGAKIARAQGCSLGELMAVNPDVNWNKLKPGQKIKLPQKK
ncbi:MAG TPA: LysM domain-containing protein [Opitutus sp.]|nr:LysM domain-containing protein [Opitutus sp.]